MFDDPRLPIWWEYQTPIVQQVRRAWWTLLSLPGRISLFRWPARTWWTQPAHSLRYILNSLTNQASGQISHHLS